MQSPGHAETPRHHSKGRDIRVACESQRVNRCARPREHEDESGGPLIRIRILSDQPPRQPGADVGEARDDQDRNRRAGNCRKQELG